MRFGESRFGESVLVMDDVGLNSEGAAGSGVPDPGAPPQLYIAPIVE